MEENTNVTEVKEVVDVQVVEKEGLGTRIKNGAKKVFSSKPAKIVGGVLLAAGGAVVGYSFANRDKDQDYDYDEDFDDYDEVPEVEESVEVAD